MVTRSQAAKAKQDELRSEQCSDSGVILAETFLKDIDEGVESSQRPVFSHTSLVREQEADPILKDIRQNAMSKNEVMMVPEGYYLENDILMRTWRPPRRPANEEWSVVYQVVVPVSYRPET